MLDQLAKELGVSTNSLLKIGIGFNPKSQSWVFAERNAKGEIIGLMERFQNGKKFMVKGSKRGLIFQPQFRKRTTYSGGPLQQVTRASPCSLCGKQRWCMVSLDNAGNPRAALCHYTSTGASKKLPGGGYLHFFGSETEVRGENQTLLPASKYPIFVVEGATDVAAITDMGLVGVGKPSALDGMALLVELLSGYDIVVIGENDAGTGKRGMELTAEHLIEVCPSVSTLMPPKGYKDVRQWYQNELTDGVIVEDILSDTTQIQKDDNTFEDNIPATIAEVFLTRCKTENGVLILRSYRGQWVEFQDGCYRNLDADVLRGQLYKFLEDKKIKRFADSGFILEPYKPSKSKINDIMDAFSKHCPIDVDPPAWLDNRKGLNPADLIIFNNGVLDVDQYIQKSYKLRATNPLFFSLSSIPHDLDGTLISSTWLNFLTDIFNGDQQRIDLLQEWFGYNMVPDMSFEKFMIFVGRPRSGKGTVLSALAAVLGNEQICSTNLRTLCGTFGYQPMLGKLAAFMGDVRTPKHGDLGTALERILQIVGRDSVSIDRKFLPALSNIQLCCRFTVALNDFPSLPDYANALEPRLLLLDFPNSYWGIEDRTLKGKLEAEAKNIIPWALEGLKRVRLNNGFTRPKSSNKAMASLRDVISPITTFVKAWCNLNNAAIIQQDAIYDAWRAWGRRQGVQAGTSAQFTHQLGNLYSELEIGGFEIKGLELKPDVMNKMLQGDA